MFWKLTTSDWTVLKWALQRSQVTLMCDSMMRSQVWFRDPTTENVCHCWTELFSVKFGQSPGPWHRGKLYDPSLSLNFLMDFTW